MTVLRPSGARVACENANPLIFTAGGETTGSVRALTVCHFALACTTAQPSAPDHDPVPAAGAEGTEPQRGAASAPEPSATVPTPLAPSLPLPSGLAFGELSEGEVLVWSRCDRAATLHAQLADGNATEHARVTVTAERDFAASLAFSNLAPGRRYDAAAWCTEADLAESVPRPGAVTGHFTTPPAATTAASVRFAWGGDLGGQNVCRDAALGYPIFGPLGAGRYAFFVALGDLIYADTPCDAVGAWGNAQVPRRPKIATQRDEFQAAWRYNREDAGYRAFLSETPYYAMWDDHEVVNDFGPRTDLRHRAPYRSGEHLMPAALAALVDYNPVPSDGKLTRRRRWGRHVELFFVDARSYRDENTRRDSRAAPKQLLGKEQTRWLLEALESSDATWKFVIASVPLSIPTGLDGNARDGFANYGGPTGFERELLGLLSEMRERDLGDTVWLTTDVHFAAGFSYQPFIEDPEFVVHEFVSGPMSAGFFPRDVFDRTLRPTRHFTYAIEEVRGVKDYAGASRLFNYGEVTVSSSGALRIGIRNGDGERVRGIEVVKRR